MEFNQKQIDAVTVLKKYRRKLTTQQYRTIKGQIVAGDCDGAMRGLQKLLSRQRGRCVSNAPQTSNTV